MVERNEVLELVLVDAANEHDLLLAVARATGVRRVLTTHGHFDHIQAVTAMRDAGIDVAVAADDAAMLPAYDDVIDDDSVITVGSLRIRAVHTPGHTPGHQSLLVHLAKTGWVVLSGDAVHFQSNWDNRRVPGPNFDKEKTVTSMNHLAELIAAQAS